MNVEGLSELLKTLTKSTEQFEEEAEQLLIRVGNKVLRVTKMNTPVSSVKGEPGGTLRRSWRSKKGGKLERIVYNNLHYAPHVEFGHRTRQGMGGSSSNPKYKYKPKEGGIKFVPGVFMLQKGVQSAESTMGAEMEAFIENLWNE